jgi:hypothetical protein
MVQVLVSIIEWFAIMALSIIGVDYDPAQPCIPTEFSAEPSAIVYFTDNRFGDRALQVADCASSALIPVELVPVSPGHPDRIDS